MSDKRCATCQASVSGPWMLHCTKLAWSCSTNGGIDISAIVQAQVDAFFTAWTQGGSAVAYTPQGLAVAGAEGVLRNAANAALLALVHARHSSGFGALRLACWAREQVPSWVPVTAWFPTPLDPAQPANSVYTHASSWRLA